MQAKTSLLRRGNCCDENIKQTAGILWQPGKDSWQPASPPRCQNVLDRFSDLDFSSTATQEGMRKEGVCFLQRSIVSFHLTVLCSASTTGGCLQAVSTCYRLCRNRTAPSGGLWAEARRPAVPTWTTKRSRKSHQSHHCKNNVLYVPVSLPRSPPVTTFSRLHLRQILCHDVLGNNREF